MSIARKIIDDLYLLNRNFCSADYDQAVDYLTGLLTNSSEITFTEGVNGWTIPPKHDIVKASISKDGQVIYDATQNPLQCISLTKEFKGRVTDQELKEHLFYDTQFPVGPDAIPFHFTQNYKPWSRTWGFCCPKSFYDSLTPGEYDVEIITEESTGYLKVIEASKVGYSEISFVFVAHLDHGGMANDDLAGLAVGVEFFNSLQSRETKYSYQFLIVQEIIGSEVYLAGLNRQRKQKIMGGIFLEMLGSETPLSLQLSYGGPNMIDRHLEEVLLNIKEDTVVGPFGTIISNDETSWEAHGIPMSSLSRYPYPEYHTSLDNPDIISESSLNESISALEKVFERIESEVYIEKMFSGLPCLSNPAIDLYVQGYSADKKQQELRRLMDTLNYAPDSFPLSDLNIELPRDQIIEYLVGWEKAGLIKIT